MLVEFNSSAARSISMPGSENSVLRRGNFIDFGSYVNSFIQLLARLGRGLVHVSLLLLDDSPIKIAEIAYRVFVAVGGVLLRLIVTPEFDPSSSAFKDLIKDLKAREPSFQERVTKIQMGFTDNTMIHADILAFKKLTIEIKDIWISLWNYAGILGFRKQGVSGYPEVLEVLKKYENLHVQLGKYFADHHRSIIDQFDQIVKLCRKGGIQAQIPEMYRQELIFLGENWLDIVEIYLRFVAPQDRLSSALKMEAGHLKMTISSLKNPQQLALRQQEKIPSFLTLTNIGNSCYLDSSFQAIFCVKTLCDEIAKPISPKNISVDIYKKKLVIQKEILMFLQSQHVQARDYTPLEFALFLSGKGQGPSMDRLRDAIFDKNSYLHGEFKNPFHKTRQMDAAAFVELLIDRFLSEAAMFEMRERATTESLPGYEFNGPRNDRYWGLSLPCRAGQLQEVIDSYLGPHYEVEDTVANQRSFNPFDENAKIVDASKAERVLNWFKEFEKSKPAEAATFKKSKGRKIKSFEQQYRLKKLPPVMVLQLNRFESVQRNGQWVGVKNNQPIGLPSNGLIDLRNYYDAPEDIPQDKQPSAVYRVKSYVVHMGGSSIATGHYISRLIINDGKNDKYYECNDLKPNGHQEISKKQFFDSTDAYLIVMEQIPKKEADAIPLPPKVVVKKVLPIKEAAPAAKAGTKQPGAKKVAKKGKKVAKKVAVTPATASSSTTADVANSNNNPQAVDASPKVEATTPVVKVETATPVANETVNPKTAPQGTVLPK